MAGANTHERHLLHRHYFELDIPVSRAMRAMIRVVDPQRPRTGRHPLQYSTEGSHSELV